MHRDTQTLIQSDGLLLFAKEPILHPCAYHEQSGTGRREHTGKIVRLD